MIGVMVPTVLFALTSQGSKVGIWGSVLAALAAVVGAIASLFVARQERESLNLDRAAAEISAHFSRMSMQAISNLGGLDIHENAYLSTAFGRLIDMGVFERADVEGPDGEVLVRLTLTPEGRKALDSALVQAEAQNAAKWADIANENGEGYAPGREAPGGVAPG
ncbi:hypothetical protein [Gordonia sp. KTR9]|uniref:hypothetical protein n=1 Tax=Gordonia sp. KTR9 TaxID=337191 RepID=UPI0005CAA407|nr:hypothetical protein [Gordonia sp. KTR9]